VALAFVLPVSRMLVNPRSPVVAGAEIEPHVCHVDGCVAESAHALIRTMLVAPRTYWTRNRR
jgi:hypothetical protein